jgi:3-oxoacyl-[acyl-carrier protein] reductase
MISLKGKVAVVTGAGHGIGREIALSLAKAGAKLVITDISDMIFDVAKQIEAAKSEAFPIKCDVSNLEQAEGVRGTILAKFGTIDILVNNAGIYPQKAFLEMTNEDWNRVMHINLDGVFHCTKAVLPLMIKKKNGKIVSVASIAGAVVGFTKSLALETAPFGININAVAPGPIDVVEAGQMPEAMLEQLIKTIPIGRMGKPSDIANVVLFLVDDKSSFVTGQCIVCDGGYTLP